MSTPKDPLLESEAPDRLHYATGVLLDAGDMLAEQTYHRGRLARALAYLHGAGTVAGLRAEFDPHSDAALEGELTVQPGLALDPLGRLVEVPRKACLRVKPWYESYAPERLQPQAGSYNVSAEFAASHTPPARAVVADLFLRFFTGERGRTPAFASGPWEALDATVPSRLRDGYELRLVPRLASIPEVPAPPWPRVGGAPAWPDDGEQDLGARRTALREAILSSWHEGQAGLLAALRADDFIPAELKVAGEPPYQEEPDPAWLFLARVVVGLSADAHEQETGADGKARPKRTGTVLVDNTERPLSVPASALARWAGI